MMSHLKVGTKNMPLILSLFSLTLLTMLSVPAFAATNQYALTCASCHGMPPLDTKATDPVLRDPATGAFQGNHGKHLPTPATAADCVKCHNNSNYTVEHYTGVIQMAPYIKNYSTMGSAPRAARYNRALFFNQTSVPPLATCSNVNCHFEQTTQAAWGGTLNLTGGGTTCDLCHTTPPAAPSKSAGGHKAHTDYPQFGLLQCNVCHGSANHVYDAAPYQHATSAGNRAIYFDPSIKYHDPSNRANLGRLYQPSQQNIRFFGKCATADCHSNGKPTAATAGGGYTSIPFKMYTTTVFGTTTAAPNNCGLCHGGPASSTKMITTYAHDKHVRVLGYQCYECHATTVTAADKIILSSTTHVSADAFGTRTFAKQLSYSGTATQGKAKPAATLAGCATTYCHSPYAATMGKTPNWFAIASFNNNVVCGDCHTAANTNVTTNAHSVHLQFSTAAGLKYGPRALAATASPGSCDVCHTQRTATPATHGNGVTDANFGATCAQCHPNTNLNAATWQQAVRYTTVTCETCHTGTTVSVINGKSAANKSSIIGTLHAGTDAQGAAMACTRCHNPDLKHIGNTTANMRLKIANPDPVAGCNDCHSVGNPVVRATFQGMSTHFTSKGVNNMACKACHDPHATTNLSMIRTQLKGSWTNATTYTIAYKDPVNGFINLANNRGLCQVCHTKTNHYRAGVLDTTGHPTSGCLGCHGHSNPGGGFKPVGGGACDSCHGYPPMPRNVAGLTIGTTMGRMNNYSSAKFENYTGGGGAHFVPDHVKPTARASEAWSNCGICHNYGASHTMNTPVKNNVANVTVVVDQKYRFADGVQITYSGAKLQNINNRTGTCTNVECHFQPSKRWSNQR